MLHRLLRGGLGLAMLLESACSAPASAEYELEVTASAYNSVAGQTDGQPTLAAWGDRLDPDVRSIAVSRDLIELGLGRGTLVRIDGLPGEYRVLDKMAPRWKRKIDLYMGTDVAAARRWGVRRVKIRWSQSPAHPSLQDGAPRGDPAVDAPPVEPRR